MWDSDPISHPGSVARNFWIPLLVIFVLVTRSSFSFSVSTRPVPQLYRRTHNKKAESHRLVDWDVAVNPGRGFHLLRVLRRGELIRFSDTILAKSPEKSYQGKITIIGSVRTYDSGGPTMTISAGRNMSVLTTAREMYHDKRQVHYAAIAHCSSKHDRDGYRLALAEWSTLKPTTDNTPTRSGLRHSRRSEESLVRPVATSKSAVQLIL